MKREDVTKIFEGATDEQINALLDINSADIGKAKGDFTDIKTKHETEVEKRKTLENTIRELKEKEGDAEKLNTKIDELQKMIDDRAEADRLAEADKALEERFKSAVGEARFLNDFTRAGILAEFKTAVADENNTGKSDAEIYAAVVKDREGIFASKNPKVDIPGMGNDPSPEIDNLTDALKEYYKK